MMLLGAALVMVGPAPAAVAGAPAPPLDDCLANATDWSYFGCGRHYAASGATYGPMTSLLVLQPPRGQAVTMTAPGDPPGDGQAVSWSDERWDFYIGRAFTQVGPGCTATSMTCQVVYNNPYVGDEGEFYTVWRAVTYTGIYPVNGYTYAFYHSPAAYYAKLYPVTPTGSQVYFAGNEVAYAIAPGKNPVAADCVADDWFVAVRHDNVIPVPDCIRFKRNSSYVPDRDWFETILPVDSGTWTVVADVRGPADTPLLQRPAAYQSTTATPTGDDISANIVKQARPTLDVVVQPAASAMSLGAMQQVDVTVKAVGGDAGDLRGLHFDAGKVLSVASGSAVEVVGPTGEVPASFSLTPGQSRTFPVTVQAVAPGTGSLSATARGTTDLGTSVVKTAGTSAITVSYVPPPGGGSDPDAPKPPTILRALDYQNSARPDIDVVQGSVKGAPGSTARVALATSATDPCGRQMSGSGVRFLGTTDPFTIGDNGIGYFLHYRDVVAGEYVYGVTIADGKWSDVGACFKATPPTPGSGTPTTPTTPRAPAAPVRKADAGIRAGTSGAFAGTAVVNSTGAGQSATKKVAKGKTAVFQVVVVNAGTAADSLIVTGGRGTGKLKVTYLVGRKVVTAAVVGGTWRTGTLAPGSSVTLTVKVKAKGGKGGKLTRQVAVRSVSNPAARDVVAFTVKRR